MRYVIVYFQVCSVLYLIDAVHCSNSARAITAASCTLAMDGASPGVSLNIAVRANCIYQSVIDYDYDYVLHVV